MANLRGKLSLIPWYYHYSTYIYFMGSILYDCRYLCLLLPFLALLIRLLCSSPRCDGNFAGNRK